MTQMEVIDELHNGCKLINTFYTNKSVWTVENQLGASEKISARTAKALTNSKSVVLQVVSHGGFTKHIYKLNPKLKEE